MRYAMILMLLAACSPAAGPPGSGAPIARASGEINGIPVYQVSPGDLAFTPGIDAGYYAVTDGRGGWALEWTADARVFGGAGAAFDGDLTCSTAFSSVKTQAFESGDMMSLPAANRLAFSTVASTGFDGLQFVTGVDGVTFDLRVDGERRADLVYFLQNGRLVTPATVPFILR